MPVPDIYVDADACPVKEEVYRVAERCRCKVFVVTNQGMRVPRGDSVELVLVGDAFDAADDWIAERVTGSDIVITEDIPLASRCLEKKALVLAPRGRRFSEDSIGDALATRELMSQLRDLGEVSGGPRPFEKRDRSLFLQRLDQAIQEVQRRP